MVYFRETDPANNAIRDAAADLILKREIRQAEEQARNNKK